MNSSDDKKNSYTKEMEKLAGRMAEMSFNKLVPLDEQAKNQHICTIIKKEAIRMLPSFSDVFISENYLRFPLRNEDILKGWETLRNYKNVYFGWPRLLRLIRRNKKRDNIREFVYDADYLDMRTLAEYLAFKSTDSEEEFDQVMAIALPLVEDYRPIRNAIAHTSLIRVEKMKEFDEITRRIRLWSLEITD